MRRFPSWWQRNTLLLATGESCQLSKLLRAFTQLGYRKAGAGEYGAPELLRGEFFQQGSAIAIFPVNEKSPWSIELDGNTIAALGPHLFVARRNEQVRLGRTARTMRPGDYVVHRDHGVGTFQGMVRRNAQTYFCVNYAPSRKNGSPDQLLVPLAQKQKLALYLGFRIPQINRLGTPLWFRIKKRAAHDIVAYAKTLLAAWQNRMRQKRPPYLPDLWEEKIRSTFAYEETSGQQLALADVFSDMAQETPMDRLVVGDVGFGKTEVALRAAVRAALNNKQTALLAPTTVLADQHAALFRERCAGLPLVIKRFTRLESAACASAIRKQAKDGAVDIVIGTHRMLGDLAFKRLGLLIIDEEQRFGVSQKELYKRRYPAVDVLTCTATPIPRTLSLSLAAVRPTSVLAEAPQGRTAPRTIVSPFSRALLYDAIARECGRGGQIYYVANRIRTIGRTTALLDTLFPNIAKRVLHGRLPERTVVETMRAFHRGDFPLLIATTIIENGLDIANANTLIIEDAGRFGLAQCHQLRGRIGRGNRSAAAYLFFNPRTITPAGERRLAALAATQYLGAGEEIAKEDLLLRGAGNVLGQEQSGVANRIGWNLYYEMLAHTLSALRNDTQTHTASATRNNHPPFDIRG